MVQLSFLFILKVSFTFCKYFSRTAPSSPAKEFLLLRQFLGKIIVFYTEPLFKGRFTLTINNYTPKKYFIDIMIKNKKHNTKKQIIKITSMLDECSSDTKTNYLVKSQRGKSSTTFLMVIVRYRFLCVPRSSYYNFKQFFCLYLIWP
jgi:hypothetical protein